MNFMVTLLSRKPVGLPSKRCHKNHKFTWCSTWIGQVHKRSTDSYCVNEPYQVQEIPWAKYLKLREHAWKHQTGLSPFCPWVYLLWPLLETGYWVRWSLCLNQYSCYYAEAVTSIRVYCDRTDVRKCSRKQRSWKVIWQVMFWQQYWFK